MERTAKLVARAKKEVTIRVPCLGCDLKHMVIVSASDAAFTAQPKGHSQGSLRDIHKVAWLAWWRTLTCWRRRLRYAC